MSFQRHPDFQRVGKQPQSKSVVDWAHPLARGLVGFYILNRAGFVENLASGANHGRWVGPGQQLVASPNGLSTRFTGSGDTDRIDLGLASASGIGLHGATEFSVSSRAYIKTGALTNAFPRLVDKSTGGGATGGWAMYYDEAGDGLVLRLTGGSGNRQTIAAPPRGVWFTVTASSSEVGDETKYIFSIDGAPQALTPSTPLAPALPTTSTNAAIGNWNHSTDRAWDGDIEYVAVWSRNLSAAEHVAIYRDPYQLLKAAVPLHAVSSVAVVLSPLDIEAASSVEQTTISPVVSLAPQDLSAGAGIGPVSISPVVRLTPQDLTLASDVEPTALSVTATLSTQDLTLLARISPPNIVGEADLVVGDVRYVLTGAPRGYVLKGGSIKTIIGSPT